MFEQKGVYCIPLCKNFVHVIDSTYCHTYFIEEVNLSTNRIVQDNHVTC